MIPGRRGEWVATPTARGSRVSIMTSQGTFFTGCNYWASHAGTAMWADWKKEVVEDDFRRLSAAGIRVLRVFPTWPDFQPIHLLRGPRGVAMEYRFGEIPFTDDEEGRAGVSKTAMAHFEEFAQLAEKYGLRLIVGLITGWMSGRLFVPPALEGRNVLTDPEAIMWEVRFVKYFVKRFKSCKAIMAWDLGNECNCMAPVATSAEAWNWISSITNAIKSCDPSRLVVSGMHSLLPTGVWTIQDQAEVTDILTTHPYPYFTPHCDQDSINTIRTGLHAAAETLFYRGIGNKPCFVEELGTLGPMFTSDEVGADFVRNNLLTLWVHDCRGFLWWCANEQSHLKHAPYDWNTIETELGYFRTDGSPKPVLTEVSKFTRFVEAFPYKTLPERIVDGICILTKGQDTWGAAYSSFVLAKQAKLDIEFQYSFQPIKDAAFYLLPSLRGDSGISKRRMEELLAKVFSGASLYISNDSALLSPFTEYSGVKVNTREKRSTADKVSLLGVGDNVALELKGSYRLAFEPVHAEVLGVDQAGNPAFTCAQYGQGKVFFLNYPLETYLLDKPGICHGDNCKPYWLFYKLMKDRIASSKVVHTDMPNLGITEHPVNDAKRIVVAINYEPHSIEARIGLSDGWRLTESLYGPKASAAGDGAAVSFSIGRNDGVVVTIEKPAAG
jgi:hypothetical protein